MGLGAQVVANAVSAGVATLQGAGAVIVLWRIAPVPQAFFVWQLFAAALQVTILKYWLWRLLPFNGHTPKFSRNALRTVWRFAAGVMGITIGSVILTQSDKVVLSRLLPLASFGYYSLAGAIAGVLTLPAMAMYAALFPAFSELVSRNRIEVLTEQYHNSAQVLSVILAPAAVGAALFSRELLSVYVGDPVIVDNTQTLLRLLIVGNLFLAVMVLPLALQLSYGWTRLSFYKNVIASAVFVPSLLIMVRRFGAVGAAVMWIALTMGYVLIEIPVMHSKLLRSEKWKWYITDLGVPLGISVALIGTVRFLVRSDAPLGVSIPAVVLAILSAVAISSALLPNTRRLLTFTSSDIKRR
jgi:O-antigen/teichoic acid export membrane protein